jgi:hypothetical protein
MEMYPGFGGEEQSQSKPIEGGTPSTHAGETTATQNKANPPGFSPDVLSPFGYAQGKLRRRI